MYIISNDATSQNPTHIEGGLGWPPDKTNPEQTADRFDRLPLFYAWLPLLWKEVRQTAIFLVLAVAAVIALQLTILALAWLEQETPVYRMYPLMVNTAFFAPLFFLLGCAAIGIAKERESHTWNWATMLPVPWWKPMLAKGLIGMLGAVIACGLSLLFAYAMMRCFGNMHLYDDRNLVDVMMQILWATLLAVSVISISLLWFSDGATGLIAGTVAVFFVELARIFIWGDSFLLRNAGHSFQSEWFSKCFILLCVSAVAVSMFRWRTATGLYTTNIIPLAIRWSQHSPTSQSVPVTIFAAPRPWIAMLRTSLAATLLPLTVALLACLIFRSLLLESGPAVADKRWPLLPILAIFSIFVLIPDLSRNRWRFFADRGIACGWLWATRYLLGILIPSLLATAWLTSISPGSRALAEPLLVFLTIHAAAALGFMISMVTRAWYLSAPLFVTITLILSTTLSAFLNHAGISSVYIALSIVSLSLPASYWLWRKLWQKADTPLALPFLGFLLLLGTLLLVFYPAARILSVPWVDGNLIASRTDAVIMASELDNLDTDLPSDAPLFTAADIRYLQSIAGREKNPHGSSRESTWFNPGAASTDSAAALLDQEHLQEFQRRLQDPTLHTYLGELNSILQKSPTRNAATSFQDFTRLSNTTSQLSSVALASLILGDPKTASDALRVYKKFVDHNREALLFSPDFLQDEAKFIKQLQDLPQELWQPVLQQHAANELVPSIDIAQPRWKHLYDATLSFLYRDQTITTAFDRTLASTLSFRAGIRPSADVWTYRDLSWWETLRQKREMAWWHQEVSRKFSNRGAPSDGTPPRWDAWQHGTSTFSHPLASWPLQLKANSQQNQKLLKRLQNWQDQ